MQKLIIILSCLAAVALANPRTQVIFEQLAGGRTRCRSTVNCRNQGRDINDCPIVNCPVYERPPFNGLCSPPDCSNPQYRQYLHAAADPFTYWQCVRADALGNWVALQRHCACPTAFDYGEQRCVHVHELSTVYRCNAWNPFPSTPVCNAECPTCDDGGVINTPPPPVTPDTTVGIPDIETTTAGNGNDCSACCIPCIWWPCMPCAMGCACNQNNQNNQPNRPQQPIQPPTWPQQPIQPPNNQIPQWPDTVPQRPVPQPQPPTWPQQPIQPPNNQIPQWPNQPNQVPQWPNQPNNQIPQWPQTRPFEIDADVVAEAFDVAVEEVEA